MENDERRGVDAGGAVSPGDRPVDCLWPPARRQDIGVDSPRPGRCHGSRTRTAQQRLGAEAMPHELRDAVVTLRPWDGEDAAWYAACVREAEVQRFTADPPTLTAEDVARAIAALGGQPDRVAYLIADAVTGGRLGNIALSHADGIGDLSYWVAADARGRGVAAHAVQLLTAAAFQYLELGELRLWTHVNNTASQRVAEHAGFHRDPARDQPRHIKGNTWPTVAYALHR